MSAFLRSFLISALASSLLTGGVWAASILVVDMIPYTWSNETNQDSEPNLSVNPANPKQMAATAFSPDPMQGPYAPIFISTDGGHTWYPNPIVPADTAFKTDDITLRFSGSGNRLYAAELKGNFSPSYWVLRTNDFTSPAPMTDLEPNNMLTVDQPWLAVATVIGQQDTGKDRVYVGMNDPYGPQGSLGHTDSVRRSPDGSQASPQWDSLPLETVGNDGTDLAPVRIATHPDGTVYAIYIGVQGPDNDTSNQTLNAVVVRDDNWAVGVKQFKDLKTGNAAGHIIAPQITVPVNNAFPALGSERLGGGGISIAVDPNNSNRVYAVYSDYPGGKKPYTLHVLRSDTRGDKWTGDLLTVPNIINPALAVNSVGTVGLLYQQLTATNQWETHFRRSLNQGGGWFDTLLATFTDGMPVQVPPLPYLGDYAHLQALGQTFYGVFSSANNPDLAHFPSGFSFQRKVDPITHTLRNLADTYMVPVSIDPFFFVFSDQDQGDDFYVRDWTASPASGDNGVQPSTNPVFYQTSDVWNRRSPDPGTFPNDQPDNEDAGNGTTTQGDNWAFTRVRRNLGGSAATVTAHFLVSKLGVGNPYVDQSDADLSFPDPDPTLSFAAGETTAKTTVPYHWHLNQIASKHLCMAVETSTPMDPFLGKSLRGLSPGWPTDLIILNDNNRAQRNMFLTMTPAKSQPGMKKYYAILHNMATFPRDMTLQYTLSDPKRLNGATWHVVASSLGPVRTTTPLPLASRGSLVVKAMQPEEDRWLEIAIPAPSGTEGEELDVQFQEVAADQLLDGFGVGARLASNAKTIADLFENHRSVYTRLAALYPSDYAITEMKAPQFYLDTGAFADTDYLHFLSANLKAMGNAYTLLSRSLVNGDPFGSKAELDNLTALYTSGAPVAGLLVSHATLLDELDALLTQQRQMKGDQAFILQNVRWQRDLFLRGDQLNALAAAGTIVDASRTFIDGYGNRTLNDPDYPIHLRTLLDSLRQVAGALEVTLPGLTVKEQAIEAAMSTGDLIAMQKAHHDFLAQLAALDNVR